MCLNPITIPNQTKYVSLRHRDPFLMQVPCGACAECQQTLSNQWYFRAFYEWFDLSKVNGYVLFDCLTYRDADLPHLSDTWLFLDKRYDYPCFDYLHIRRFLQRLRQRLIRAGYSKQAFRYFLSTEYGASAHATHRPHIHLLFYVQDNRIPPIWLSKLIAELWPYGRTDGVPYKGSRYVLNRCYIPVSSSLESKLRTCRYVTKYVQKCCEFQSQLNKRISSVMFALAQYADPVTPESWLETEYAHRERLKLMRMVNQFHRQSQHFGESALQDIDLYQLFADGCLYMPDSKALKIPVPLPMYYKRKLFQELVEFNGSRYWQLTELGKQYNEFRQQRCAEFLEARYRCVVLQFKLPIPDVKRLVNYVLNERGIIKGDLPKSILEERIDSIDFINYSTSSDKMNFGCRGLSLNWLGDSQQGYSTSHLFNRIPLSVFVQKYCFFDSDLERQLDMIYSAMSKLNSGKQSAFVLKQRLKNLYKFISV